MFIVIRLMQGVHLPTALTTYTRRAVVDSELGCFQEDERDSLKVSLDPAVCLYDLVSIKRPLYRSEAAIDLLNVLTATPRRVSTPRVALLACVAIP